MGAKTPKYHRHVEAGARIVDFGGWDMPLHYGSQKEEHHAVRSRAGVFDVSHMTVIDVHGEGAHDFLRHLLANDVDKLKAAGQALYTCMLNDAGGIIDDLIVYHLDDALFRMIVNATTRAKVIAWVKEKAAPFAVTVEEQPELAMLAAQGPQARDLASACVDVAWRERALALKPFFAVQAGELFIARTGYTGEDGFEIVMPAERAVPLWDCLLAAGIRPCGLGARDSLRLEAGMNLYGADMDETVSPLEAGLGWTVAWEPSGRAFVGRRALEQIRANPERRRFVGMLLEDKGVLRRHQRVVVEGRGDGEITSGGFSPTLNRSIALARLPAGDYDRAKVEVRGKLLDVRIVKTPFVRQGKARIELELSETGE